MANFRGRDAIRTYGRSYAEDGTYTWVEVSTDANGFDDAVWLTTMAQVLQLHLGESPFFANFGIPQYRTLVTQIWPDYYVTQTQIQFLPYFVALSVKNNGGPAPNYTITAIMHNGAQVQQNASAEFPT